MFAQAARLGLWPVQFFLDNFTPKKGNDLVDSLTPFLSVSTKAVNEATCTWSGQLPPRNYKNPIYSCKVFLGGVPWDITEGELSPRPASGVVAGASFRSMKLGLEAGARPLPELL